MKFPVCCIWLANLLDNAGGQGNGVVAATSAMGHRRFVLQGRALTREQLPMMERIVALRDGPLAEVFSPATGGLRPIVTMTMQPLLYCPHCGTDLNALVERNQDAFDSLAATHADLVDR